MPNRADDWLRQAERDLEQAEESLGATGTSGHASPRTRLPRRLSKPRIFTRDRRRGDTVSRLLTELPPAMRASAGLIDRARVLDNFYIPTRYADAHPEGAPFEHYGPLQSEEAIRHARAILDFVRHAMAER